MARKLGFEEGDRIGLLGAPEGFAEPAIDCRGAVDVHPAGEVRAMPTGLVDNKVCAVDDTWSGLRPILRKELRPGRSSLRVSRFRTVGQAGRTARRGCPPDR